MPKGYSGYIQGGNVTVDNISKNYIYNVTFNILNILVPFLTTPYLARVLGSEGVGLYTYYFSIVQYFTLFAKLGLTNYGTRILAAIRDDNESLSREFTTLYVMQISATLIVFIIYIGISLLFFKNKILSLLFSIWLFLAIFDTDWLLFALEEFKIAAVRNCIVKVISTIFIFFIVRKIDDLWKYVLITSLSYGCGYFAVWIKCRKYLCFKMISWKDILKHTKPCFVLLIPVLSLSIYRTMDKVMLGLLSDMRQTGLYDYAEKLIYCLTAFISSFGSVMMPKMANLFSKNDKKNIAAYIEKSMIFIVFLSSGMCFGISVIADSLIPILYGYDFEESIKLLKILAITLIFIAWGNVIRTQYAIPCKRDDVYIWTIVTGALVNLLANAFLIPNFKAIGACIGTVLAELSVVFLQFVLLKNELPYKKYIKETLPFILFGVIMYFVCLSIKHFISSIIFTLLIQIMIGLVFYVIISYLYIKKLFQNTNWLNKKTLKEA